MLRLTASEGRARPRVARAAPTAPPAAPSYARHVPERMLLYALVQAHYPDLLARLASEDRSLPEYMREEFDAYPRCGVLDHGFLRKAPRDDLGATPQARTMPCWRAALSAATPSGPTASPRGGWPGRATTRMTVGSSTTASW